MYERFYNLRERPFALSPDPDYLYPSKVHKEALSYLRYGIEGHAGFIVITGEIGSGKTTLLQTALRGLDQHTAVSRVVNTMLDARDLVESVMLEFGLDPGHGLSKPYLLRDLARFLVDQRNMGRLALLVIDEAQNLSMAALEEIRMLSNLETEKSKLVQIALIGQSNLRDVLARPELEQLRQRITVSYHLSPLGSAETNAYVNHRLRRAAIGAPLEFSRDVTDLIHLHSQGVPRKINVIADAVLLFGYGEEQRAISVDLTHTVLEELDATGIISAPSDTKQPAPAPLSTQLDLEAREQRLAERERLLVEQQRILVEEYRQARVRLETQARSAQPLPAWPPVERKAAAPLAAVPPAPVSPAAVQPAAVPPAALPLAPVSPAAVPRAAMPPPLSPVARSHSTTAVPPSAPASPPIARRVVLKPPPPSPPSAPVKPRIDGFWARVRRGLLGIEHPVFED